MEWKNHVSWEASRNKESLEKLLHVAHDQSKAI